LVKLLLAEGADMDAKSDLGWTALISAAFYGKVEVVNHFISGLCKDLSV